MQRGTMMATTKNGTRRTRPPRPTRSAPAASLPEYDPTLSLATLWAHILGDEGEIENQIQILRPGPGATWLVQYYSFLDGGPAHVGIVAESTLLDAKRCV